MQADAEVKQARERYLVRRYNRIAKWSRKQPKEKLVEFLSAALLELMEEKHAANRWEKLAERLRDSSEASEIRRSADRYVIRELAEHVDRTRQQRREGGMIRHSRDPKQAAKAKAHKLWLERYAGKHPKLRTNDQFAMECMRQWPALTSIGTIKGWCTEWTKAEKSQPAS